ncbi:MAG: PilZ domain-containing protein [Syntrophaceae bacterium]|nr:PilZ domain-containing protein [Syntrophaceae bacterium]
MEEKGVKPRMAIANLEKRKHPRFTVDLPIEYFPIDASPGLAGRLVNVSEGGLLVYFPERLPIGQHLKMRLFFTSGRDLDAVELVTEVVWEDICLERDWGYYRFGVRFVEIAPDDLNRLKDFLRSLAK